MANEFDEAMNVLAAEAESERLWKPYAEWCRTRARRLTEQAEIVARQFSEAARQWPFDDRKRFAVWLVNSTGVAIERCGGQRYQSRFSYSGPDKFESRTVVDVVVRPTLAEWRNTEPSNPEPCFWIALYDEDLWSYLQEARRLDPMHGPTCEAVVVQNIRGIEYNQHELPSGYLDDPADDLTTLTEAEVLLAHAVDPRVRQTLSRKLIHFEQRPKIGSAYANN